MKKQISILLIVCLLVSLCLIGCANSTEQLEQGEAIAIYTADGTLYFLRATKRIAVGRKYEGSRILAVYTGIETTNYDTYHVGVPWVNEKLNIKKVVCIDEITPISIVAWFSNMQNLIFVDLSMLNTSKVANMDSMFAHCSSLTELDLSNLNTTNVESMRFMFADCNALTKLNLSNFDTSNVANMSFMFNGCSSLQELDLSNFDTSNVTTMNWMFHDCSSLTNLDISGFNTENVTEMDCMFENCSSLIELDLNNFSTLRLESAARMFMCCSSLTKLNISNFDTSIVTNMFYMFHSCINLQTIYVSDAWTTDLTIDSSDMFLNCSKLIGGAGTVYDPNCINSSMAHIDGGTDNPGYLTDIANKD